MPPEVIDAQKPTLKLNRLFRKVIDLVESLDRRWIVLWAILIFAFCVIKGRNAISHPSLFTEDGHWLKYYLNDRNILDGLLDARKHMSMLGLRSDYFVFFNLVLLNFSCMINELFFGDNILNLPYFIAACSYSFYALHAILPLVLFDKKFPRIHLITFSLLALMVPMRYTENEIFGRLSNIGFLCFNIALYLTIYRTLFLNNIKNLIVIDFLYLALLFTNPLVLILLPTYLYNLIHPKVKILAIPSNDEKTKTGFACSTSVVIFTSLLYTGYLFLSGPSRPSLHPNIFNSSALIEILTAKSLLNPYIFPFYSKFNDFTAILLSCYFLGICSYITYISRKNSPKLHSALLLVLFYTVFAIVFIAIKKPGLTGFLNDYRPPVLTSRYYLTQNILSIFLAILASAAIGRVPNFTKTRVIVNFSLIFVALVYVYNLKSLFSYKEAHLKTIQQCILAHRFNPNAHQQSIDINPHGWFVELPNENYLESIRHMGDDIAQLSMKLYYTTKTDHIENESKSKFLENIKKNTYSLTSTTPNIDSIRLDFENQIHNVFKIQKFKINSNEYSCSLKDIIATNDLSLNDNIITITGPDPYMRVSLPKERQRTSHQINFRLTIIPSYHHLFLGHNQVKEK